VNFSVLYETRILLFLKARPTYMFPFSVRVGFSSSAVEFIDVNIHYCTCYISGKRVLPD